MTIPKTRSLRRYEGEAVPVAVDSAEPKVEFFSPFGPFIAKTRFISALVDRINAFADRVLPQKQSAEMLVPPEIANAGGEMSLLRQIHALIARYIDHTERAKIREITIDVIWIVNQYASTPSPMHFHSGDISGVLYLKTPQVADEEKELQKTYISGRQAGYINFLIDGKRRLSRSVTSFRPVVGDFYIFPGWLLHGAEPFRGPDERRSLAFNADVKIAD